jgi:hypothetical protein
MAQTVKAVDPFIIHPNDVRTFGFGFGNLLPSAITVSSVTSVVASGGDAALTTASAAVITSESIDALGHTIAADKGVSAKLSTGTAGQDYIVTVIIVDSGSETVTGVFDVFCRAGT